MADKMIKEFETMWQEAVLAYLRYYTSICL